MQQHEIEKVAVGLINTLRRELRLPSVIAQYMRKKKPIVVKDLNGSPSYWLVPLVSKDRIVGFLRLGLEGELLAYGRFGQGQQLHDFPPLSYLSEVTANKEIRKAFGDIYEKISPPQLVHDGPVDRIAWLSVGKSLNRPRALLFWIFGASYSRPQDAEPSYGLL